MDDSTNSTSTKTEFVEQATLTIHWPDEIISGYSDVWTITDVSLSAIVDMTATKSTAVKLLDGSMTTM